MAKKGQSRLITGFLPSIWAQVFLHCVETQRFGLVAELMGFQAICNLENRFTGINLGEQCFTFIELEAFLV